MDRDRVRSWRPSAVLLAHLALALTAAWWGCGPSESDPSTGAAGSGGAAGRGGPSDSGTSSLTDGGPVRDGKGRWPQLLPHEGIVLSNMTLVTIVSQNDRRAPDLFAFDDFLMQSHWWETIRNAYNLGPAGPSLHWTGPPIPYSTTGPFTIDQVKSYITGVIASHSLPSLAHSFFLLYVPQNVELDLACAYHYVGKTPAGEPFAFGVTGDCAAIPGSTDVRTAQNYPASHEIAEGATNPFVTTGWSLIRDSAAAPWNQSPWLVGQQVVEGSDLCDGTWFEGPWQFARMWSNVAATSGGDPCIPAVQTYYNVVPPQDWTPCAAGQSVEIPLLGWATASTADWMVGLDKTTPVVSGVPFPATAMLHGNTTAVVGGETFFTINNGRTINLRVAVSASARHGAFGVFRVGSLYAIVGPDGQHRADEQRNGYQWMPIGIYVP